MSDSVPSEVQPWLLLGERRRRSLENRIRAAAERWAAHWVAGTVTVSVAVEPAAQNSTLEYDDRSAGHRKTIGFAVRGKSGEWLAELGVPHRLVAWAAGLGAVDFSAIADLDDWSRGGSGDVPSGDWSRGGSGDVPSGEMPPPGEIEFELVRGFWDTLIPQALAVDASLECLNDAQAEEAQLALAKRGVRAACAFGPAPSGCNIQVTLSPTTVAMLLAERRVGYEGAPLTSRRSALALTPVPLDCCLGSVQVPVRDLHSLRIGDVLVTDVALDGHAELRVRNKPRPIAAGTLGEVEGRKALKVETARVIKVNQGLRP
jgi:flagellar motor switch/type III secretory pathway protein FliN